MNGPKNPFGELDRISRDVVPGVNAPKSRTYTDRWGTEKKVTRPPFGVKKRVKGGKN